KPQSTIDNRQSPIDNRQSTIDTRQSTILIKNCSLSLYQNFLIKSITYYKNAKHSGCLNAWRFVRLECV
ncbi:MAG: hypothetical protein IJ187_03410, partial [Neisseriaceae bacterium]|nr:hypothetical protein [Neisseriaceae bacterium]